MVFHPSFQKCAPELLHILPCMFLLCIEEFSYLRRMQLFFLFRNMVIFLTHDYQLVALTSVISKVFETVISGQLRPFLERGGWLIDLQYRFRLSRSAGDLSVVISHSRSTVLNDRGETHPISQDISKSFDRVLDECLLSKLYSFGFGWMSCLLNKRANSVRNDGILFQSFFMNIHLRQGSVHAPILFPLFINDLVPISSPLPVMPLFIALFPTQVLFKPLRTSIRILLFLLHHLLPIWDGSLLGTLTTMSVSTLQDFSFLPNSSTLLFSSIEFQLDSSWFHQIAPIIGFIYKIFYLLVSISIASCLSCFAQAWFSIPHHTLFCIHQPLSFMQG